MALATDAAIKSYTTAPTPLGVFISPWNVPIASKTVGVFLARPSPFTMITPSLLSEFLQIAIVYSSGFGNSLLQLAYQMVP